MLLEFEFILFKKIYNHYLSKTVKFLFNGIIKNILLLSCVC